MVNNQSFNNCVIKQIAMICKMYYISIHKRYYKAEIDKGTNEPYNIRSRWIRANELQTHFVKVYKYL